MFRVTRPQALLRVAQSHSVADPRHSPALVGVRSLLASGRHDVRFRAVSRTWRTGYSTKQPPEPVTADRDFEKKIAQKKLEAHPSDVTTESSLIGGREPEIRKTEPIEPLADLKADLAKVKDGLALDAVPRASYLFGFAGTIPYLTTSLTTLYLSWNLSTQWPTDSNLLNAFLMSHETANHLLGLLEPVQVGYGAVILTFLGAVHWGLELGEKEPADTRTRFRYVMGFAAPVFAWPTMMLPVQWALITQFLGFVSLYFADARATTRGWTPHWYTSYRFVLTAIVGASLLVTLIARTSIGHAGSRLTTEDLRHVSVKGKTDPQEYERWEALEEEERERLRKEKEEEEKKKAEEVKTQRELEEAKKQEGGEKRKSGEQNGGDEKEEKKDRDKKSDNKNEKMEEQQSDTNNGGDDGAAKKEKEKKD